MADNVLRNTAHGLARIMTAVLLMGIIAGSRAEETEPETWTSQAGQSVEATLVEIDREGMVTLRTPAGHLLRIALDALAEPDQERARTRFEAEAEARRRAALRDAEELRVILPEAYRGRNETVIGRHETPAFDVFFYTPSAQILVFVKENGAYFTPPIRVGFSASYVIPDAPPNRQYRSRRFVEMAAEPEVQGGRAHFRMTLEHGVHAETWFEVQGNSISFGYQVIDPPDIEYPSNHRMGIGFPAFFHEKEVEHAIVYTSPRFPEGIDREALLARLEGMELLLHHAGARGPAARTTLPFNQGVRERLRGVTRAEFSGGVYGLRTVRLDAPRLGSLVPSIYRDNFPAQGVSFRFTRRNPTAAVDQPAHRVTLTIE